MNTWQLLTSAWDWKPSVVAGCAALVAAYAAAVRFRFSRAAASYAAGVLLLLLALVSPLDTLGDDYLFSAHMLQHMLLVLVIPPLLLLGIPEGVARQALSRPLVGKIERALGRPLVAWTLAVTAMLVWHVPALYDAALENEGLHVAQHLCFLVTASVFWWPVVAPLEESRLQPPLAVFYLFSACLASSVLGILITFAPAGLYRAYLAPDDARGVLPLVRDAWGLSPATDQQLGGLLMWVPCCVVYLCAIMLTLARWYSAPEEDAITASSPPINLRRDQRLASAPKGSL